MQLDLELYREHVQVESGVVISYIDVAPDRPLRTFILIHGFGGNAKQWQYQFDTFAQENHVVAIDLRGHGQSSHPDTGYDMDTLMDDILAVLNQAEVQTNFVLVGHSFGVAIATEFAVKYPERVTHLVLIAGAGEYKLRLPYRLVFHLPLDILAAAQPLVNNFIDASLVSLRQMYLQNLRDWQGWDKFPLLDGPTLVILGNRDQVLPQEVFERVAELIPKQNSEVINVNVSAHMVMMERRDAVNRAISRFVDSSTLEGEIPRWRTRFETSSRGSLLKERPWLAFYGGDVPATIHVPQHPLTRLLQRSSRRFPNRTAIIEFDTKLSYRFLMQEVLRFANGLYSFGIAKQTKVMLLLPNCAQLIIAYYGALEAGSVIVMGNPLAKAGEIIRQINLVQAEFLITWKENPLIDVIKEQTSLRQIILTQEKDYISWFSHLWFKFTAQESGVAAGNKEIMWSSLLRQNSPERLDIKIDATDTAVIQFTSGTSSLPKGVMLSHKNLLANVLQMRAWFPKARDGKETALSITPMSHIYGMTAALNYPISQGATIVILPRFNIEELLQTIRKYAPSFFPGVPSMFVAIKDYEDVRKFNVEMIRICLSSGSQLPVEVEEAFEKVTKAYLVESYGLTEASSLTHVSPQFGNDKIGSIGLPLPSTEARIIDLDTRRPLPPGQIGELVVRGPQVMQGYWQDEELTKATINKLGWLATGDIARMDSDGYFQIISRSQEMWRSADGHDTIYPRDIEEIIYELPSVEEVVVILFAGRPIAFVKVKDRSEVTKNTITAYCRRRLPPNLVPRRVVFASDFPRNLIGRVLRHELVEEYESEISEGAGGVELYLPGLAQAENSDEPSIPV